MGPTTPSRFALNEASWSGTARSAGYEWTREPPARATARLTPVRLNHRRTLKPLDRTPHTSRARHANEGTEDDRNSHCCGRAEPDAGPWASGVCPDRVTPKAGSHVHTLDPCNTLDAQHN